MESQPQNPEIRNYPENFHQCFNLFKLNGISHCYQLDQSIFFLRIVELYFLFLFKLY